MIRDRMEPADSADATVSYGPNRIMGDVLVPKGRYEVWCIGPEEPYRDQYVTMLADIDEAESTGDEVRLVELVTSLAQIPTEEKWRDTIENVVTTVGKNDFLDKYLKGSAYTQTIRMGLAGTGSKVAGDTQASHAGWLEVGLANAPTYTGNRKDVVMGAAAAGVSTSPTQAFAMTGSGTVSGCFINNGGSATKDDTTGVLFSAGNFTAGDKIVTSGDTINVVYTLTV